LTVLNQLFSITETNNFMGLEKAIKHKKEKRKLYTDSKRFDYSCRNHGGCDYCKNNRTFFHKKQVSRTNFMLMDYWNNIAED
jgi:hypothetical protein